MPLLIVLALLALPFAEIALMIAVGSWIGAPWTIALLFLLSAAGVLVLRRAGTKAFREADAAMRTGTPPQGGLLGTLMLMVGGILLAVPGFLTAAVGAVLALPFTRPLLRWAFASWAERRIKKMGVTVHGAFPDGSGVPGQRGGSERGAPGRGKVIQGRFTDSPGEPGAPA
ncbi:FxsA family protein [Nocardiopsis sp. CNT-189]|uniref:FxsA family protein n=1 Tax=Nocardiopsis oceanisediminis TaxID=2816862 RepID=UPI003B31EE8B